jgi:hypothetical protein
MTKKIKHQLVVEILLDRPATEDEAVRMVRIPLSKLGVQSSGFGPGSFCITTVKSLTRIAAKMKG